MSGCLVKSRNVHSDILKSAGRPAGIILKVSFEDGCKGRPPVSFTRFAVRSSDNTIKSGFYRR